MQYLLKSNSSRIYVVLLSLPAIMALTMAKDLIHAAIKDYHFYWSESMLFESFWLLFVPLLMLHKKWAHHYRSVLVISPIFISVFHLALFALIVFSVSGLFFTHTFGFSRIFTDSMADYGIACLLFYGTATFIFTRSDKPVQSGTSSGNKIRVTHRNKVVILSCDEILFVKTERPYIALVTKDRTYLHNATLKGFIEEHLSDRFVRIHKSTVVNTDFISSFSSRNNGDYDVVLSNGVTIRASRNYNRFFRSATVHNRSD